MAAHASLGASSAKRWMTCPRSPRLIAQVPPVPTSIYAEEGTAAHWVAESVLRAWLTANHFRNPPTASNSAWVGVVAPNGVVVTSEMLEAVHVYLDWVFATFAADLREGRCDMRVEQRLSLAKLGREDMFGTTDLLVYYPQDRLLWIADYKHGKGVAVDAAGNVQTLYYALGGALHLNVPVDRVTSTIVQPRADHFEGPIRHSTVDSVDLTEFAAALLRAAERTEEEDAPLVSGEHCRFCPAAAICPRLAEDRFRDAGLEFSALPAEVESVTRTLEERTVRVELLTAAEITAVLKLRPFIDQFLNAVEAYAHRSLESGHDVTDGEFKLVAKRAIRKWADNEDVIADSLCRDFGLGDEDMFKRTLRSPADIEKQIPKDKRKLLSQYVTAESSGTTLAPASDKRPAVMPGKPGSEFSQIETE